MAANCGTDGSMAATFDGSRPRVVILGGGFAGLSAARRLRWAPVRVTVVDRQNHHLFQPLLYQVATGGLDPSEIARPIRRILRRQENAEVLLAEATAIDLGRRVIELSDGSLEYDYLILGTGAAHSYFGHDEWARFAPGLKTLDDALEIRRRVLLAFERAERELDPEEQERWMTFAVIGGGPTGVELAGTLAEIVQRTLARDFRHIHPECARVILIEALPRVLPPFPEKLSEKARQQLVKLGVEVRTNAMVSAIDAEGVVAGGQRIAARTVLWGAGVAASPLARTLETQLDKAGRVEVASDLSVPGHPEVMVVGDLAHVKRDGGLVPGVAQAAIQEGKHAALNILASLRDAGRAPFRYRDRGTLATIGRKAAVGQIGRVQLSGQVAWLAWLAVHLVYLVGFRNRLLVLLDWAYSYFTYERGARLITGVSRRSPAAGLMRQASLSSDFLQEREGAPT